MQTFWHSSSHILGQALELEFGVDLTIGPSIEEGFYYDCYLEDGRTLTDADKAAIEKRMQQASSNDHIHRTLCYLHAASYSKPALQTQVVCKSWKHQGTQAQCNVPLICVSSHIARFACVHVEPTSSPAFSIMSCLHAPSCQTVMLKMQVVKESQSFQRVVVTRDEALAMFQENKFKVEIISGLPQTATISLYRSA